MVIQKRFTKERRRIFNTIGKPVPYIEIILSVRKGINRFKDLKKHFKIEKKSKEVKLCYEIKNLRTWGIIKKNSYEINYDGFTECFEGHYCIKRYLTELCNEIREKQSFFLKQEIKNYLEYIIKKPEHKMATINDFFEQIIFNSKLLEKIQNLNFYLRESLRKDRKIDHRSLFRDTTQND